ncbi:MAG TPA: tRNA (adenosine(37)-N6)-dimethylallyltransferase MiaA [Acidimicrobiia bacterium]|nr:tRNA (adenosine(37)-N6)-dimethylallyltransferase MiaA [Acidimicrobiia bacterium]
MIVGPTAAGKSSVALQVAERVRGRILSLDSMQVYRGMDVGTAKPTASERRRVPHSMLDLVDPAEEYTVEEFQRQARHVIETSEEPVVLVGGSGLHMRAVIDPLEFLPTDIEVRRQLESEDPGRLVAELTTVDTAAGEFVDLANPRRVVRAVEVHRLTGRTPSSIAGEPARQAVARYESLYPCRIVGLDPGPALAERIDARLTAMMRDGFYDEVERLAGRMGRTAGQAVGYRELSDVVAGRRTMEDALVATRRATVGLARRQRAWFRRDPRVAWIDPLRDDPVTAVMETA